MSIDKITSDDQLSHSKDVIQENIDQLKKLFPEIVSEGKIDFKTLQQILGEEIEDEEEFYRFTWAGKSQARKEAHKPSTGTLRPCKEESLDWDTTQNLYIEGDNLEVLKLLQKSYSGKIKMIYIDPPYNTGKDFVYKDNYKDNLKNYQEVTGQIDSEGNRLSTNSDSDGRFHSNWLNMMYPRLRLSRNLLKDDGVIFVSIGDDEYDNLKKVMDEIFGEINFISNFIWNCSTGGGIRPKHVNKTHEYLLMYSRDKNSLLQLNAPLSKSATEQYRLSDDFGGLYREKDFVFKNSSTNINQKYFIECPDGELVTPKDGYIYRFIKPTFDEALSENKVVFKKSTNGPLLNNKGEQSGWNIYIKKYLGDGKGSPLSILPKDIVGLYNNGTSLVQNLFDNNRVFENVKSLELIIYLLEMILGEDDVVLDFFSGSSTSAHAVLEFNRRNNKISKFFQVQLPHPTESNTIAYKLGYKNISEIGKERIRRVVEKIKETNPDKSVNMDLGFKVLKLDSSNIKSWDGNPDNLESSLFDSVSNIKSDRSEEDVLYEILLKYGLDLTLPIEERDIQGKKVFNVGMGSLFICLSDDITSKVAEGIGEWKEECDPEVCRVIFKDNGFTDVEKTNSVQILKRFGINEIRSI